MYSAGARGEPLEAPVSLRSIHDMHHTVYVVESGWVRIMI